MDVSKVLADAWKAVEDSGVPAEIQLAAFAEAVTLVRAAQAPDLPSVSLSNTGVQAASPTEISGASVSSSDPEDLFYNTLAQELKLKSSDLEGLFYLYDGSVRINRKARQLGNGKAEPTRKIAQLLTVAYLEGLGKTSISAVTVREECQRIDVFDPSNNSSTTSEIPGLITQGKGEDRVFKLKGGSGLTLIAGIISELVATD